MPVDDPSNGGETDAHTREFVLGVQSLKSAEQLVGVDHVKADTVVPQSGPVQPARQVSELTRETIAKARPIAIDTET